VSKVYFPPSIQNRPTMASHRRTPQGMAQIDLVCSNGGKAAGNSKKALKVCGKCRNAQYCNVECQTEHWKRGGHKSMCSNYLGFVSTGGHVIFELAGGAGEAIDLPPMLSGKKTHETLAQCMDFMLDDSKALRKKYEHADSEECWVATEVIHTLVLGYIVDKQWSMASTFIIKWYSPFLVFQNSFTAGEAGAVQLCRQVQSHVLSMKQNGALVTQMMLNNQNECMRLKVIEMPLGRARTVALYEIVDKLISEQDGWKKPIAKTTDIKLHFMVEFDRECVSILMNMGMVSGNGVDVNKTSQSSSSVLHMQFKCWRATSACPLVSSRMQDTSKISPISPHNMTALSTSRPPCLAHEHKIPLAILSALQNVMPA